MKSDKTADQSATSIGSSSPKVLFCDKQLRPFKKSAHFWAVSLFAGTLNNDTPSPHSIWQSNTAHLLDIHKKIPKTHKWNQIVVLIFRSQSVSLPCVSNFEHSFMPPALVLKCALYEPHFSTKKTNGFLISWASTKLEWFLFQATITAATTVAATTVAATTVAATTVAATTAAATTAAATTVAATTAAATTAAGNLNKL